MQNLLNSINPPINKLKTDFQKHSSLNRIFSYKKNISLNDTKNVGYVYLPLFMQNIS